MKYDVQRSPVFVSFIGDKPLFLRKGHNWIPITNGDGVVLHQEKMWTLAAFETATLQIWGDYLTLSSDEVVV